MFLLILLYLVFTIIRPQDYMAAMSGVEAMPVILGSAFLVWVFSSNKSFAEPQYPLLVMFLLAMMMSQVTNGWAGGAWEELKTFGPFVIAFIVLSTAVTTRRRVIITIAVISICTMVLAAHGIQQARTGVGWTGMPLNENGRIRYVGIFNDPNDLGLLFVMALPMTLYLSGRSKFLFRVFWLAGAVLLLVGVYLTESRGTQLAVMVIFGVYMWRKRGLITAGALGGMGLVGLMLLPSSRMQDMGPDEPSAFGRVDAWYEGLHMFISHPLFGVGAGNFTDYNYLTAHNSLVLVLAETGFFGYVAWLAFVGYCFWMMLMILRHKPQPMDLARAGEWREEQALAQTLFLSLCGFFTAAFFLSRSYIVLLYLLAAIVVGHYINARRRFPSLPAFSLSDGGWRWIPIGLASIIALYVLVTILLHTA